MLRLFIITALGILIFSCKSIPTNTPKSETKVIPIITSLSINTLKANEIEEKISGADEILMTYSLFSFDENNQPINAQHGSFGVEKMTSGTNISPQKISPLSITLPSKGKIVASLVLMEIDDYEKAQKIIQKLTLANGLGQIPAMFLQIGEAATPLKYLSWAIMGADASVKGLKYFDGNDILGQFKTELQIENLKIGQNITIPIKFNDKNYLNHYDYEINLSIGIK